MDYESIHGRGESNFSSPSQHRMPTVSAADALRNLNSASSRCVSTGLKDLDSILQNRNPALSQQDDVLSGGVSRGSVTEVYGPPGVGKTALGMQLAASSLLAGERVYWLDAAQSLSGTRLLQVLASRGDGDLAPATTSSPSLDLLDNLVHMFTPTLAHLISILSDQSPSYTAENASLLVIDSFSTLINNAFPRTTEASNTPMKQGEAHKPPSRKYPVLQYLITALQKLAAKQNIAIVVLSQCMTKIRPGAGAALIPAINNTTWEQGLGGRIALYRDWGWDNGDGEFVDGVRFAQVLKAEGVAIPDYRSSPVAFTIQEYGLHQLKHLIVPPIENVFAKTSDTILPLKRKLAATEFEIPDSDDEADEDYGWAEEDEQELPAPPPQWQGSEDILIVRDDHLEPDEPDDDEGDGGKVPKSANEDESVITSKDIVREEIDDSEDELAL